MTFRDGKDEKQEAAEVGSVALDRMVVSFMEDGAAVDQQRGPPTRGGGRCSNCFNGQQDASDDDDEDDFDFLPSSSPSACSSSAAELIKGLVQCASAVERALLADATRIADRCGVKQAVCGRKRTKAEVRRAVADGLRSLGYDAAVCRSRWDNNNKGPPAEHEYIDALLPLPLPADSTTATQQVRLVVEVDFRAEFEVARPTKPYRAALQALPPLFVGTPDRVGRVVAVVAEAARQSLRKRGLHFPPWRKAEYMRAKWLAPHARLSGELRFDDEVVTKAPKTAAAEDEVETEEDASNSKQPEASKAKVVAAVAPTHD
ncbi:hypothetical protein PR202_ga28155 [Eleusine coracana subsp. coracana]|uniref:Plant-specific domain TIGR01615 family protein n=1 Tax=Eleusine coracana subsp. coracana TaxID=191504 RepID=A0AAV5DJ18_ELECO|nr:hypothetical protein PR202_ga28155 [Eleusine coracana subsp. coracana]